MKFLSSSTSLLLVLAMTAKYVDAGVAITGPLGNTWAAGSSHIITWTDNGDGTPMPATFNIDLMTGPMTALQLVGNVATNIESATGQHTWSVPATITPGKEYALRFGTPPNVAYSPYFEISAPGSESGSGAGVAPAPAGGVAGSSSTAGAPSAANTGPSKSAQASSSGAAKPSSMSTQSVANNKPTTTTQTGVSKLSGSNKQAIIPSIGLAILFSLITLLSY